MAFILFYIIIGLFFALILDPVIEAAIILENIDNKRLVYKIAMTLTVLFYPLFFIGWFLKK